MDPSTINWQELTATAAICGVFIWGITKGLPNLVKTFTEDSAASRGEFTQSLTVNRDSFTVALSSQRAEFRADLAATREQSRLLAQSGHDAINRVTGSVNELGDKVEQLHDRLETTQKNGN
jgi:hypothetical protein